MYYGTITVTTKPGKRFAGIDHLKKLAQLLSDKYQVPTEVVGNTTGLIYQNHLVSKYQNLAQVDEVAEQLLADPAFQAWFQEAASLLEWQASRRNIYQVMA